MHTSAGSVLDRTHDTTSTGDRSAASTRVDAGGAVDITACYEAHGAVVRRHVRRICGDDLAGDVTQDVFVSWWSAGASYDPSRGSVGTLLMSMAKNRAIDVARQRAARDRRDRRWLAVMPAPVVDDVCAEIVRRERADDVHTMIAELRSELQEPIRLAFFEDLSYREVAERLGLPEGTVKSRIRIALHQMRGSDAGRSKHWAHEVLAPAV